MSYIEDIVNTITGNLATDLVKAAARKTGNTKLIREIERRLNPEQLHSKTRDLIAEALAAALDPKDIDPTEWKNVFDHPENRVQIIGWVLEWKEEVKPDLREWSLENAPNPEQLRGRLERLHEIIQEKKHKHFGAEFFNTLGVLLEMLAAVEELGGRFDTFLSSLNTLFNRQDQEKACPPEPLIQKPPIPYFVHSLDLAKHFTGRVEERGMLTEWLTGHGKHGKESVLVLRAIGGMGKSSVAWVWVRRDVAGVSVSGLPEDEPEKQSELRVPQENRPEGILWYSFYEGGGTFKGFLEAAIAYCSGGERTFSNYTSETKAGPSIDYGTMQEHLTQLLQRRRFLLIWDGTERLLREYACVDATMREEREPEEMEPKDRDILDRPTELFLKSMTQSSSRLLLTSRLYPLALEGSAGAGELELKGLGKAYSVTYLQARGIRGIRAELESVAEQYEFHPLSLSMLAADLREDFEEEGDIAAAPRYEQTEKVKARQHHILECAYNRRAPHRQELLSRMAAMRGTIPKDVVRLLAEEIADLKLETLGKDLDELVRHGLLRRPSPDRYDFHPLVRRYCYQRLEKKEAIHRKLMSYYQAIPPPEKVTKIEDLTPTIELYHHTVRAGLYDEAIDFMYDRLGDPLFYQFGAYQTYIELLRTLFPDGEDRPSRLKEKRDQAWTLNALSNSYSLFGQPRRAVPWLVTANAIDEKRGDKENLAIGVGNLATQQMILGELKVSEANLRRSISLCREIKDKFREAVGHQELGRLLAYEGAFDEAAKELQTALSSFGKLGAPQSECVVWAYRALRALLVGEAEAALEAARRSWELAEEVARTRYPVERDFVRAEWLMGWSKTGRASERPHQQAKLRTETEGHLTEALTRCRRINMVDHEPDILLAWARWHRLKGDKKEAKENADEALSIADRCEYRLCQADIHNFLAQLALDDGDRDKTKEHAEKALGYAECDGPPHYYKPAYEEAERLLKAAGG